MLLNGAYDVFLNYPEKISKPKRVLITGFGPYGEFNPNPSWEAVEAMDTRNIKNNGRKIILLKEKVAVRYVDVDLDMRKLLDTKKPHLTIHVGVSKLPCLRLEKQANKYGYKKHDSEFFHAMNAENPAPGPNSIATSFDIKAIQDEYNKYHSKDDLQVEISEKAGLCLCEYISANAENPSAGPNSIATSFDVKATQDKYNKYHSKDDLQVEISEKAGLYLCEYIYYTSLSHGGSPTLFVHVPPNKPPEQLARGLERIVEVCFQQLHLAKCSVVNRNH